MKDSAEEIYALLCQHSPFNQANPGTLQNLLPHCRIVSFPQGADIFVADDEPNRMYLLLSGVAEIWQGSWKNPHPMLLAKVQPGQCLGEIGFFDERKRTVSVRALEEIRALEFFPEARDLMLADPALSKSLIKQIASRLRATNQALEFRCQELEKTNRQLRRSYTETVLALSQALELRDRFTAGHSERVTAISLLIGRSMGLSEDQLYALRLGAMLHDIGKIGIPDAILHKPGKLDEAEWVLMKTHPELGRRMIEQIDFLRPAIDVVYCHHEKWAGGGYPRNLSGEQIPLNARIFALADVFDALVTARSYKQPWAVDEVIREISRNEGIHFDPEVVRHFHICLPAILDATERSRMGDPLVDIIQGEPPATTAP